MTFFQCSYCEDSFRSDEERKKHEEVCVKNGKTDKERFEAKMRLKNKNTNSNKK